MDQAARGLRSERRQPTVLFCDLVDFTGLMRSLDPEDLSRVMNAYERACGEVIERYHGHLYTFEGDGFRVLFGYPEAHEDDAERAVRAGLEIVEAVAAIPHEDVSPEPLAVRIGIATGLVVVEAPQADAGGAVAARGEAPTLASRLQAIAEPRWVVVSQSTRMRLGALFQLDDLGDVSLKGYPEPVPAWRVTTELAAESRFAAMRGASAGAMIGREHELTRLLALWKRVKEGHGSAVLVSGEAGIGKSRLIERLAELVRSERHYRLRYQCSPFHGNSALYPFASQLARIAGEGESGARLARLEERLVVPPEQRAKVVSLVAELLSIPSPASKERLSPEKRKEQLLWMLWQQMIWLADQRPVLILFEDAHWLDPTSLELIQAAIARLEHHRVLLVITHRPEFTLDARLEERVERVEVGILDHDQSLALARSYASPIPVADVLLERIADHAGGVPLFIEELTSWVLAALTGREDAEDGTTNRLARSMSVPATLQDSLMARLDQLGPAKQVAQLGAVIGREFSREILAALWPEDAASLGEGLARLEEAQLLVRGGEDAAPRYAFRHALIHEQAYECLLRSRRMELHARVVELIETRFCDLVERDTEVVARHCEQAGLAEQAVRYWSLAAAKAMHRSANREAINHIRNALAMLEQVGSEEVRQRFELDLHVELGAAYQAVRGFASSQAMHAFERARELCEGVDEVEKLIDIQRGLYTGYYVRGQHRVSRRMAEDMLALGSRSGDASITNIARYLLGASLFWQGEFASAASAFTEVLKGYDAAAQRYEQLSLQIEPLVAVEFHHAWTLWMLGYPEQAWTMASRAVEHAEDKHQPLALAMSLFVLSAIHASSYSGRGHAQYLGRLCALTEQHDLAHPAACAKFLVGQDLIARGDPRGGLEMIERGMRAFDEQEAGLGKPWGLSAAALACLRLGELGRGLDIVAEALALVEHHGEYQWQAELHRVRALLLEAGDDAPGAERSLERAIDIARAQQARSLELRACTSLARLGRTRVGAESARSLLAPLYAWFSEGFLIDDLKEAGALLSQLD